MCFNACFQDACGQRILALLVLSWGIDALDFISLSCRTSPRQGPGAQHDFDCTELRKGRGDSAAYLSKTSNLDFGTVLASTRWRHDTRLIQ